MRTSALFVFALAFGSACASTQKPAPLRAQLRTIIDPPVATVQVDEQFVGAARVLEKRPAWLAEGKHRVTIEAAGYFPHDLDMDLPAGITKLEVKLRPIPR